MKMIRKKQLKIVHSPRIAIYHPPVSRPNKTPGLIGQARYKDLMKEHGTGQREAHVPLRMRRHFPLSRKH